MKIKKIDYERLLYIEALLLINGGLRRSDLAIRFGVSEKTVTLAIKEYEEHCPGQMFIDKGLVRPMYVQTETCKPCLFKSLTQAKKYQDYSHQLDSFLSSFDDLNK